MFPECGAHVSREGSNFVISSFDAKKLSIEKVTILEVLSDNDYAFACGENSKEPKFVALVVSNEKSIKLRSFNLAGKEESNHLLLQKDLDFHLTEVQDVRRLNSAHF